MQCQRPTSKFYKFFALTLLLPSLSYADTGSFVTGILNVLLVILGIWCALTILLFNLLRRQQKSRRHIITGLFFFSPLLIMGSTIIIEQSFKKNNDQPKVTIKTQNVCGVAFPRGSKAIYDADENIESIYSPFPVRLGNIQINSLIFIKDNCHSEIRANVVAGTILHGWPCGESTFSPSAEGPILRGCFLAAPAQRGQHLWETGAYIEFDADFQPTPLSM